jgi:hypothetical protein
MEHDNILDLEEQERSFLYGNHSFHCFGGSLLCGSVSIFAFSYIDEINVLMNFISLVLLIMVVLLALLGCYYSIQGIRLREAKRWRAVFSLLLHFGVLGLFWFTLNPISHSVQIPPEMIPISE